MLCKLHHLLNNLVRLFTNPTPLKINKIMHNDDLDNVRDTLLNLKDIDCKILFYDMSI